MKHERMMEMEPMIEGEEESKQADPVCERKRGDGRELCVSFTAAVGDLLGHLAAL